MAKQMS
jgi:hypothetical protein